MKALNERANIIYTNTFRNGEKGNWVEVEIAEVEVYKVDDVLKNWKTLATHLRRLTSAARNQKIYFQIPNLKLNLRMGL